MMTVILITLAALAALTCYCCCVTAGRADKALAEWKKRNETTGKME